MERLYVAFKGRGNSSNKIVNCITGEKIFLTNSFDGLKRKIAGISKPYNSVYMFGLDKSLKGHIRIESIAIKDKKVLCSDLNLNEILQTLNNHGIYATIGSNPKNSLCNEAFWYMLQKFDHQVAFFHVPSIRYINEEFLEKIKSILSP